LDPRCFDTSSFIECWAGRYRRTIFAGLWDRIEDVVQSGDIWTPEEVLNETKRKDDGLHDWMKDNREMLVVPLTEKVMDTTREVLDAFPRLTGQARGRNQADPFVVALARVEELIVVTEEGKQSTERRPRIPLVCEHFDVPCTNMLEFIEEQGWTF
jgi:uncharacterized protein DUF4411